MIDLAIDFETYWDAECSIRKLAASQYVKHPDFHVQTLTCTRDGENFSSFVGDQACQEFFDSLRDEEVNLIAHNMAFDGFVASHRFGYVPQRYTCTQSMANALLQQFCGRGLDDVAKFLGIKGKVGGDALDDVKGIHLNDIDDELLDRLLGYNEQDTRVLWQVWQILRQGFPQDELDLIDLTLRMFCEPVLLVDGGLAKQLVDMERAEKAAMAKNLGVPQNVFRSAPKLAAYLESLGYEVPYKWSEKQEKEIPALAQADVQFLDFKANADERLMDILAARKRINSNLVETRAKALLARADEPLPVGLRYCGAHTFRFSGMDRTNLQNLPSKGVPGKLRHCLLAPPGHKLVIVDAAQIEARINAWLAGQDDLVRGFANGEDVYSEFASDLFGFPVNKQEHYTERYIGKTCILGLGYQMSARRLKDELYIGRGGPSLTYDLRKCDFFVTRYRTRYAHIRAQWYKLDDLISVLHPNGKHEIDYGPVTFAPGQIKMPNGLSMYYPGVAFTVDDQGREQKSFFPHGAKEPHKLYGGILTENIVQSLARTITSGHMLELSQRWRVVHMAHDEIILCVPEDRAEDCLRDCCEIMEHVPSWATGLPLEAEGDIADHYLKPE